MFTAAICQSAHSCVASFEIMLQSSPCHALFCTFAHSWSYSVSHREPVKEVAQLPLLSHTGPIQGDEEVSTMEELTDCVMPAVFLGKSNILVSTLRRQDAKAFRDASHFRTRRVQGFSLKHLSLPRRNINIQVYIAITTELMEDFRCCKLILTSYYGYNSHYFCTLHVRDNESYSNKIPFLLSIKNLCESTVQTPVFTNSLKFSRELPEHKNLWQVDWQGYYSTETSLTRTRF